MTLATPMSLYPKGDEVSVLASISGVPLVVLLWVIIGFCVALLLGPVLADMSSRYEEYEERDE